jgi:hypothetical protein
MDDRRLSLVYAELNDGNVGIRMDMTQYGPCSVVQTP